MSFEYPREIQDPSVILTDSAFYDILKQTIILHLSKANPKWSCRESSLPVAKRIRQCSDHEEDYLLESPDTIKNEIRQHHLDNKFASFTIPYIVFKLCVVFERKPFYLILFLLIIDKLIFIKGLVSSTHILQGIFSSSVE